MNRCKRCKHEFFRMMSKDGLCNENYCIEGECACMWCQYNSNCRQAESVQKHPEMILDNYMSMNRMQIEDVVDQDSLIAYLKSFKNIAAEIRCYELEVEEDWAKILGPKRPAIESSPIGQEYSDMMVERMAIVMDEERFITKQIKDLYELKEDIVFLIEPLPPAEKMILRLHHFTNKTMNEICRKIGFSRTSSYDLLKSATDLLLKKVQNRTKSDSLGH